AERSEALHDLDGVVVTPLVAETAAEQSHRANVALEIGVLVEVGSGTGCFDCPLHVAEASGSPGLQHLEFASFFVARRHRRGAGGESENLTVGMEVGRSM